MWFLAAEKERERAVKLGGFLGFSVAASLPQLATGSGNVQSTKCFVRDDPMTWAIICLVASTVAEKTDPDAFGIYLTALGVAAAALAHILFPKTLRRR